MTKEEFNRTVNVGDIVSVIGLKDETECVVMNKTEYGCNLWTTEQSSKADGVMRPSGSYYRTYDEIIRKVGSNSLLHTLYLQLIEYDKTHQIIID